VATKIRVSRFKPMVSLAPGYDHLINGCVIFLMIFGMLMTSSASISSKDGVVKEVLLSGLRQGAFIIVGLIAYDWLSNRFSWDWVRRNIMSLIAAQGLLLVATRMFSESNGSYGWIKIPGLSLSLQPAEFAKAVVVLVIAVFIGDVKGRRLTQPWDMMRWPVIVYFFYIAVIIFVEKDFGSAFILAIIGCVCFMVPDHRYLRGAQVVAAAAALTVIALTWFFMTDAGLAMLSKIPFLGYKIDRFKAAADPLFDRYGSSYQLVNSLIGFARGGLWGVGFGNSIQKFGYLTYADTDFIFAIVVEELGVLGVLAVFVPYGIILFNLFKYALLVRSTADKVALIGTATLLFAHLFLNIGGVTALIPLTGVPLLLISRGGSSLCVTMMMLGISQNVISRYRSTVAPAARA